MMEKIRTREVLWLAGVIALGLLARVHVFLLVKNDPAFVMPIVDSLEYDIWAYKIFHHNWLWDVLPYHLPLYPYFVAGIYKLFGYSVTAVAFSQYALSVLVSVSVFFITRRLSGDAAVAFIAVILTNFYWFFIYLQTFLFSENLSLLFNTLFIFLIIFLKDRPVKYLLGGICLGLSVASRPDILIFAGVFLIWLLAEHKFSRRTFLYYVVFLLGLAMVLGPIVLRNRQISDEPVLLRTQVGVNFYIGNHPAYKGTAGVGIGKEWEETISLPERTYQREVSESESDAFFFRETFKIIRGDPAGWLKLVAGKLYSVVTGRDFLRTEDVYFHDNYFIRTPYVLISTRMIFIFFIVGLILSLRRAREFLLLYLFLLAEAGVLFFQIKTRYLLPVFPFVIIFSSLALRELYAAAADGNGKKLAALLGGIVALYLAALYNPLSIGLPTTAETHYAIAKNFTGRKQSEAARFHFERALQIEPGYVSALNDLGVLYLGRGMRERACRLFEEAIGIDPLAVRPQRNLKRSCREASPL